MSASRTPAVTCEGPAADLVAALHATPLIVHDGRFATDGCALLSRYEAVRSCRMAASPDDLRGPTDEQVGRKLAALRQVMGFDIPALATRSRVDATSSSLSKLVRTRPPSRSYPTSRSRSVSRGHRSSVASILRVGDGTTIPDLALQSSPHKPRTCSTISRSPLGHAYTSSSNQFVLDDTTTGRALPSYASKADLSFGSASR
jgi:hypothetical protein